MASSGTVPFIAETAVHVLVVATMAVTVYWTWAYRGGVAWTADPNKNWAPLFNWHPLMMQLGFICFFSEAALLFRSSSKRPKATSKLVHMTLQIVSLLLGIVAIVLCYIFKGLGGFAHFYSTHSWIGLVAIALFAVQVVSGVWVFYWPGGAPATRAALLPWHTLGGVGLYILMLITVATGLQEKVAILVTFTHLPLWAPESICVNVVMIITLLLGAATLYTATLPKKSVPAAPTNPVETLEEPLLVSAPSGGV